MGAHASEDRRLGAETVRSVEDLQTPALLVDLDALDANIATMSTALPGTRLRPHVKAHKCTALARRQYDAGHRGFTCATIREVEGMVEAGLGDDLLLANEVADASRLGRLVAGGARVILAVDSAATVEAAANGGVQEVLIDVNVGMPRCGCEPGDAGAIADLAREKGLIVRGVMGYEGHAVLIEDQADRTDKVKASTTLLADAYAAVGGEICSGGGTGSFDMNEVVTEIQAGSYVLMDTAYLKLGLPFASALSVLAMVISVNPKGWVVADCGLKALGMDHGNPLMEDGSSVWYCSDEHTVFSSPEGTAPPKVGDQVRFIPAHVDPTVAYHESFHVTKDDTVVDVWPIDLRGW